MEWVGWALAAAAIAAAVVLWRRLGAEQIHAGELLYAKLDAENALDALRAKQAEREALANEAALVGPLAEATPRLCESLEILRAAVDSADADLAGYRERVARFDAAVQYCLQPVELIFGADKATLDQLVAHVEGARRKLFEARSALERHPLHRNSADALAGGRVHLRALIDYARGLDAFSAPGDGPVDVNSCLDDALRVLAPRLNGRVRVGRAYAELPPIHVPAARIRQACLHLLDHAAHGIDEHGTLTASTRRNDTGAIEIAIAEGGGSGRSASDTDVLFDEGAGSEAGVGLSYAQQLVEELGGTISVRTTRGLGSTFTLSLPLAAAPAAS
jgi:signal transduction histidine kinase